MDHVCKYVCAFVSPLLSPSRSPRTHPTPNTHHQDEARWIARRVKELYVSFGTASFTWEERQQLYRHSTTAATESDAEAAAPAAPSPSPSLGEHQIAILVRSGWQLRVLEEALVQQRLPYVVQGGASLVAGKEVRCCFSLVGGVEWTVWWMFCSIRVLTV